MAQMKLWWNLFFFLVFRKTSENVQNKEQFDEVIRAPVGGQAGGGKSAKCTPEGWAGPGRGQSDEIKADDPITPS